MATTDEDVQGVRNGLARLVYAATALGSVAWLGASILAPVLRSRGHGMAASFIYAIFAPVCHQIPARSFHVAGFPMAVCGRCLGIYAGFLAGLLAFPLIRWFASRGGTASRHFGSGLPSGRIFLAFSLPIGVDFAGGVLGLWNSTNAVHFATGFVWGTLLPFYFLPGLLGLFARRGARRVPPAPDAGLAKRTAKP